VVVEVRAADFVGVDAGGTRRGIEFEQAVRAAESLERGFEFRVTRGCARSREVARESDVALGAKRVSRLDSSLVNPIVGRRRRAQQVERFEMARPRRQRDAAGGESRPQIAISASNRGNLFLL